MNKTTVIRIEEEEIKNIIKDKLGIQMDINWFGLCFGYGLRSKDFELIEEDNIKIKSIKIEYEVLE